MKNIVLIAAVFLLYIAMLCSCNADNGISGTGTSEFISGTSKLVSETNFIEPEIYEEYTELSTAKAETSFTEPMSETTSETTESKPIADGYDLTSKIADLGIPLSERYRTPGELSRFSPDIISFEGSIYIGGGDDENNCGPVPLYAYNEHDKCWYVVSEEVPEEKIKRFQIIDNTLMFGGTDPIEDWTLGNFYFLENGKLQKRRTIPAGAHNYDLAGYNGKLYIGIGSTPEADRSVWPALFSEDRGSSFNPIPFNKNGKELDIINMPLARVYNIFEYNSELYCTLYVRSNDNVRNEFELYCLDKDGNFDYAADLSFFTKKKLHNPRDFTSVFEYGGQLMLINENGIYSTKDFNEYWVPDVCGAEHVYDMNIINGTLYVLGANNKNGIYENIICISNDGKSFVKQFSFETDIPAYCFTCGENGYYFCIGNRFFTGSPLLGSVYFIPYE